tara:strand:- start:54932 stop:55126 length:195 start_codon:yes stop_codon:yes gene_type:complete
MKNSHTLFDPCAPESSITFTELPEQLIEVAETCHPDIPEEVSVVTLEEGRRLWRLCRTRGLVAA